MLPIQLLAGFRELLSGLVLLVGSGVADFLKLPQRLIQLLWLALPILANLKG